MAIATLFAGLLATGAALAPQADVSAANPAEPVASEEIEVAAVMDSGDPVQLLNRGVDFARQGETERARAMFGDAFVDWFSFTRRHEADQFRRHVSDLDRRRYLDVY